MLHVRWFAYVEVNGRAGILIAIKTGSGRGGGTPGPVLFLFASEPMDRLLATTFPELMYCMEEGVTVGPVTHLLSLYDEYSGVSGLNINIKKTTALCINTPASL